MSVAIWARTSLTLIALFAAAPAMAAGCARVNFDGAPFTVCKVIPGTDSVSLHYKDRDDALIGSFNRLEDALDGRRLDIAMNAGMYHADRRPVGLYIENGEEITRLVTRDGPGNFGLLPNGVLCLTGTTARIIESRAYAAADPDCSHATQSGPMLVIDGALHPRFLAQSESLYIRNGAGVRADGTLVLAISDVPVNFHHFGRLFRDALDTPNALYFDGNISKLYARDIGRRDIGLPMGPILAVTSAAD